MFEHLYDGEFGKLFEKFDHILEVLSEECPHKYNDIYKEVYILLNGCHFNEYLLEEAYDNIINDDGTRTIKWGLADTVQVAKNNGIVFDKFNEFDWNYVMNMMYSDYKEVLGESVSTYARMAYKFLMDKDAPEGKAFKYYMAMRKGY